MSARSKTRSSQQLERSATHFVRFVVDEFHEKSGQFLGIFHAVRYLRDDGRLTTSQERAADEVFDWLFHNLVAPRKGLLNKHPKAISWFQGTAAAHLAWARRLVPIAGKHGYQVALILTANPGRVVYEDDAQVFAESA